MNAPALWTKLVLEGVQNTVRKKRKLSRKWKRPLGARLREEGLLPPVKVKKP